MTPLDANVCEFILAQPFATATACQVREHFANEPADTINGALQFLADRDYLVVTEAGTRFSIPHAFIDGRPVIGAQL